MTNLLLIFDLRGFTAVQAKIYSNHILTNTLFLLRILDLEVFFSKPTDVNISLYKHEQIIVIFLSKCFLLKLLNESKILIQLL